MPLLQRVFQQNQLLLNKPSYHPEPRKEWDALPCERQRGLLPKKDLLRWVWAHPGKDNLALSHVHQWTIQNAPITKDPQSGDGKAGCLWSALRQVTRSLKSCLKLFKNQIFRISVWYTRVTKEMSIWKNCSAGNGQVQMRKNPTLSNFCWINPTLLQ